MNVEFEEISKNEGLDHEISNRQDERIKIKDIDSQIYQGAYELIKLQNLFFSDESLENENFYLDLLNKIKELNVTVENKRYKRLISTIEVLLNE
tara:strand:+ start:489 stop:770 length:282 start_codon:yes stop_codon:yes gene_type:complete